MKAYETSERYAGKLRECCNYAARTAKVFAQGSNNTKRQPCGEDEKLLASNLKEDLSKFCDTVVEENFAADQKAYILSNLLVAIFMILSIAMTICSYFIELQATLFLVIAAILALLAFLAFFGAFGGTSKDVTGVNVLATRNPKAEVKNRIIIEANLDAPFKRTMKPHTARALKTVSFIAIILYLVLDIIELMIANDQLVFDGSTLVIYLAFPLAVLAFIPFALSRSVIAGSSFPGVVDNLVGCYTAAGALRYMSEMDLRLENTELCVLLTGAKNANLSGARTYCKLHAEADAAVDTTIISLYELYNAESISIITNGKKSTDLLAVAAANADVTISNNNPKYIKKNGSAKIFKKNKYSVATITSLKDPTPVYLGTADDTVENINISAIESAMKLVLEAAYAKDSK